MKDKIVFITGATSGIGKETARGLAQLGSTIVFTTRDELKGEETKDELSNIAKIKNHYINFTRDSTRIDLNLLETAVINLEKNMINSMY